MTENKTEKKQEENEKKIVEAKEKKLDEIKKKIEEKKQEINPKSTPQKSETSDATKTNIASAKNTKKDLVSKEKTIEREYTIPLRERCRVVPRYKKTNKAIKTIKEFLARHMKIRDRDLNKIKIDKYLNEFVWARGIKKPPAKVKVKAIKQGEIVRVELIDYNNELKFKKLRDEKKSKEAEAAIEKKKSLMDKVKENAQQKPVEEQTKSEEDKNQEEKQKAGKEGTKEIVKTTAKQTKHQTGGRSKQKTQPVRKALAK